MSPARAREEKVKVDEREGLGDTLKETTLPQLIHPEAPFM